MVLNDFTKDSKILSVESGKTFTAVSEELGVGRAAVSIGLKGSIINKRFTSIIESLGYDIKVEYIKRDE